MSILTETRVNKSKKSVVKDHCIVSGHVYSFDGFTGLNYANLNAWWKNLYSLETINY